MASRKEIGEALIFIVAIPALAAVVFAGFWLVIKVGNFLAFGIFDLARAGGLPSPLAATIAVLGTAALVGFVGPRAFDVSVSAVNRLRRARK